MCCGQPQPGSRQVRQYEATEQRRTQRRQQDTANPVNNVNPVKTSNVERANNIARNNYHQNHFGGR